jgi:hypothetical protein
MAAMPQDGICPAKLGPEIRIEKSETISKSKDPSQTRARTARRLKTGLFLAFATAQASNARFDFASGSLAYCVGDAQNDTAPSRNSN